MIWPASEHIPNPTISACTRAPLASALSSGSSTSIAPPSPRIIPLRSFENGRHVSGEITRIASHAFRKPMLKTASLPPVIAISASPPRTARNACPIAWLADEHAVETVYAGPVIPNSIEMWLAPALAMVRAIVSGWTRFRSSRYRSTNPTSCVHCPPTHDPVMTVTVSPSTWSQSIPESRTASRAAMRPNCAKRSMKSARFSSKYS